MHSAKSARAIGGSRTPDLLLLAAERAVTAPRAIADAIITYDGHREAAASARKRMREAGAEIRSAMEEQQLDLFEHEVPEGAARAKLSEVVSRAYDPLKLAESLGSWDRAYELGIIAAAPKRIVKATLRERGYSTAQVEALLAEEPVRTYRRLYPSLKR